MGKTISLDKVQDLVAEQLGLDPENPLANDDEGLVSAYNDFMDKLERDADGDDVEVVDEDGEVTALADLIRERGDEINALRERSRGESSVEELSAAGVSRQKTLAKIEAGTEALADVMKGLSERNGVYSESTYNLLSIAGEEDLNDVLQRPAHSEAERAFQRASDDVYFIGAMLSPDGFNPKRANWSRWKCFRGFQRVLDEFAETRAMETGTDAAGGYWAPTQMSAELIEKVYGATNFVSQVPRIDFPANTSSFYLPTEGSGAQIYLTGEADVDDGASKFTASTPGTGRVQITAKQLASRVVVSWEMIEDSVVEIMPYIRQNMIRAFQRGLSDAMINGSTAGTHPHADVTNSSDRRKAFDGVVDKVYDDSAANEDAAGSDPDYETLIAPLVDMNLYADPEDTVLVVNHQYASKLHYLKDANGNYVWLTSDKRGGRGASETGDVPTIAGYPVIRDSNVRNDVGATGFNSGVEDIYTVAYWVNVSQWRLAVKRDMRLTTVDRPEQGQQVLVGHWRGGFQNVCANSSDLHTAMVYGIPSS